MRPGVAEATCEYLSVCPFVPTVIRKRTLQKCFSLACFSLCLISIGSKTFFFLLLLYQLWIKLMFGENCWLLWLHDAFRCPPVARFYLLFLCFSCSAFDELFFSAFPTMLDVSTIQGRADRILYIFLLYKHMLVYICFIAVLTLILFRCQRVSAVTNKLRDTAIVTPCAAHVSICLLLLCLPSQVFNKLLINIFQDTRGQPGSNSKGSRYANICSGY